MVTNYPHSMTAHAGMRANVSNTRTDGFGLWVQLGQMLCGLRGHDTLMHFEMERMSLRCVSCGHETPGWELNGTPPTVTVRVNARRHVVTRPQLVSARRVA
jgi:hypothetical protein